MRERICKHQDTIYDTTRKAHLSFCHEHRAFHFMAPISRLTCESCPLRIEPDEEDRQLTESLADDIYGMEEHDQRSSDEVQAILETYCFKCKHFSDKSKVCTECACQSHAPVDEYAKYKHLHCPLELW